MITVQADTKSLSIAIGQIVSLGRRTVSEQCVTSAGYIALNAARLTPFTDIARIDAELDVLSTPAVLKNGTLSRNKKRQREVVAVPNQGLAEMIVVARMHPNSRYSRLTGNRWPVAIPQTHGVTAFWSAVHMIAARMVKSRHSSTHFLQSGWKQAIRTAFSSPLFQGKRGGYFQSFGNTGSDLGNMVIDLNGDSCIVVAENNVGEDGNAVLNTKRREALIQKGLGPMNEAIAMETSSITNEIEKRLLAGVVPIQKME